MSKYQRLSRKNSNFRRCRKSKAYTAGFQLFGMAAPPKKNPRKGCRPVRRQTKIHCPTWVPESAGSRRDGKIGNEFGISLAPLIARAVEIQASAQKAAFEEEEAEFAT